MNPEDAQRWQQEALDEVLRALAAAPELRGVLVFKGARVLALRLGHPGRRSLDVDSNLTLGFTQARPEREAQRQFLDGTLSQALRRYFEHQATVRFQLRTLTVKPNPPRDHPHGWNAFVVRIGLSDARRAEALGLPALVIDVAAPEALLVSSVAPLEVGGGGAVDAYTLERIAGEKLRAFLSSLPAYRAKVVRSSPSVRVKDLHDLAKIRRDQPMAGQPGFWRRAAAEFRLACASRFIDCAGLATFQENWAATRDAYEADTALAREVAFAEAEEALRVVIGFFDELGLFPLSFPLPGEGGRK